MLSPAPPLDGANVFFQRPGHIPKHRIARLMTIRIVKPLEEINIDEQQGKRLLKTIRLFNGAQQVLLKKPVVMQSRHAVGGGERVRLFIVLIAQRVFHDKNEGRCHNQGDEWHRHLNPESCLLKEQDGTQTVKRRHIRHNQYAGSGGSYSERDARRQQTQENRNQPVDDRTERADIASVVLIQIVKHGGLQHHARQKLAHRRVLDVIRRSGRYTDKHDFMFQ